MSVARHHAEWLSLVPVSGPFLSLPVLMEAFNTGLEPHDPDQSRLLRQEYGNWQESFEKRKADPAPHRHWIKFVLTKTLELDDRVLAEGQAIPQTLQAEVPEHHEFRSVAPQSDDTVFDTVRFGEVPSRLVRARGSLERHLALLKTPHDSQVVEKVKQLSRLCCPSARQLDDGLTNRGIPDSAVPSDLSKETILSRVRSKAVHGRAVGMARQALRFTVKNL